MVFSSVAKRDQHMKYSPAHTKSVTATEDQAIVEAADTEEDVAEIAAEDLPSSRTIYSGIKFFWRTGLNVELFLQQHDSGDAVQVSVAT